MLSLFTAIKAIALASYLALALLTLRSQAERRVRVFFSIYLFGMLVWQASSLAVNFARDASSALLLYNLILANSATYTILFFPLTRALLGIRGQRLLAFAAYALCGIEFIAAIVGNQTNQVVLGKAGYWVPVYTSWTMYTLSALSVLFWGFGYANLVRAFVRERSPVQRNRIAYIMIGAAVTLLGAATNLTPLKDYPVDISANLASALIIGYAIVRHRLMDIRFILARSLFYSVLTASLIAVYLGFILGLEGILKHNVGYSSPALGVVAILALALLFLPFRNFLQSILDKVFFREKGDYQRAVQAFSRSVASLYDEEAIIDLVGETILAQVKPSFAAVYLHIPRRERLALRRSFGKEVPEDLAARLEADAPLLRRLRQSGAGLVREETLLDPEGPSLAESSLFRSSAIALAAPIFLEERLVGLLVLGEKLAGTMYNKEDLSFLATLANQTAAALDKSQIFQGIRRRLSEQTLLFILSEKFRSSADFDAAMDSIVFVLKNFLGCPHCALVYFDKSLSPRLYAHDPLSVFAAELAAGPGARMAGQREYRFAQGGLRAAVLELLGAKEGIAEADRELLAALNYSPLLDGDTPLGVLVLTDRAAGSPDDEQEEELQRTIRAILVQGIVLYRTIVNLSSVESYNEKILNSLNDMGDTLLILDGEGRIRRANLAACKLLGYEEAELLELPVEAILGEEEAPGEARLLDLLRAGPVSNREMAYRARSGARLPMLVSGSLLPGESPELILIARDMSERRKAEEASKSLLLIQEIHHRIKNNLQVISSLLFLQAGYVQEERVREMFKDSQNRVRSMALIHEKLYRSQTPSSIYFADYVNDLVRNLFASYSLRTTMIELSIEISDISLGMDTAVPCGLIINELVSNALKHAFPDGRAGRIVVGMLRLPALEAAAEEPARYELTVSDNGVGFPGEVDFKSLKSLGLKIVSTLSHQLHGEVEMLRGEGTRFVIRLRETGPGTAKLGAAPRDGARI